MVEAPEDSGTAVEGGRKDIDWAICIVPLECGKSEAMW